MSGKSRTARRNPAASPAGRGAGRAARRSAAPAAGRTARLSAGKQAQRRAQRRRRVITWGGIAAGTAAVVAVLYVIFSGGSSTAGAGKYPYQAGSPGAGRAAPGFTLAASTGANISLSQFRGKTVLLFFQEGLTCQPCWDQITDLQKHAAQLRAAGIGTVVSITSDPVGAITAKARDMGLTIPVLSDPNLAISQHYHANSYGMMGASRDGHTFIVVGPDGTIRWRADYGGAPKYTMFLPTTSLLADIKAGGAPVVTAITLLTQEDCAYCEHARQVLAGVGEDHPLEITEISLASEQGHALAARAGVHFAPGLLVDGRPFGYGRISERRLRRTLQQLAAELH